MEYRSVRFETEILEKGNYQGNAVVNYTDTETPYTRIIEHKWFNFGRDCAGNDITDKTVISKEYSLEWKVGVEPYYPVIDDTNIKRYLQYKQKADSGIRIIFGGRLGEFKYYDMDQVILSAINKYSGLEKCS